MSQFRCTADIVFDEVDLKPGQICNVRLKQYSETCNFLQYLKPLTPEKPYFYAQIKSLNANSKITLGIAGPDIAPEAQPGNWLDSVGYQSDTGQCYTCHQHNANTIGEKFGVGDLFGVLVNYFGDKKSTVIFIKNGSPVATRYHFESDQSHFLPTVSLENGPIDLILMLPEATTSIPSYSLKNMLHWIHPPTIKYDAYKNMFICTENSENHEELTIQSPQPLTLDIHHYEVIIQEMDSGSTCPSISLASCSPKVPSSASSLLQDYIRFDLSPEVRQSPIDVRLGWGVHYDPDACHLSNFNPKQEQLVYCYVTANSEVISGKMMMQPEGGFYPVVILNKEAAKVIIQVNSNAKPVTLTQKLDEHFRNEIVKAKQLLNIENAQKDIKISMFRMSAAIDVTITEDFCRLHLPKDKPGIHVVQFLKTLNEENSFYLVRVNELNENSSIGIGVAGKDFPLNKFPGKIKPSVGWASKDGKLYRNSRSDGNLPGEIYQKGDLIGVEMEAFAKEMSVALFIKNLRPVGTAYYTQSDRSSFLPTLALCSNGCEVILEVHWQNTMRGPPIFSVVNLEHWCLPPGAKVDSSQNKVIVKDHELPVCIQAPYSLHKGYNHFEVEIHKLETSSAPPPAIVLSTATPLDPPPLSCLKLDYLRFWPVNDASTLVKVGDKVGWGLLYLDDDVHHDEEQLVICYLTINRKILLVRVVSQPPGGFYPLVVLPPLLNEVTLVFSATIIKQHPITDKDVQILVEEAMNLIEAEKEILKKGDDPATELAGQNLFRLLPSAEHEESNGAILKSEWGQKNVVDTRVEKNVKTSKMLTVITAPKTKNANKNVNKNNHKSSQSCRII
ncbi:hypothetical protein Bpfe_017699 [Biomphalaria pfeifferi]|uniref:B30.2/SPRY domain-containing protein n=1 Tax=Biomphalaria pfeifferi TaxID=112525 RepID=A0AAD8BG47_BIOPF|nr:hypothetical protein Bpfe_017699 [Biomphalaria pfeifferi]